MADNYIDLDFGTSAPIQSVGRGSAHVPEGPYALQIKKVDQRMSGTNKPMVVVNYEVAHGEHIGKPIMENFVIPRVGSDDSTFGLERLHGLMVACGMPRQTGAVRIDLTALLSKIIVSELGDDEYNNKVRSAPQSYYATTSGEAAELMAAAPPGEPQEPVALAAPIEAAPPPVAVAPVAAPVAAVAPPPVAPPVVAAPVADPAAPLTFGDPTAPAVVPAAVAASPPVAPAPAAPSDAAITAEAAAELNALFGAS